MKYMGMPMGMWALFAGSFQKQLTAVFGYDTEYSESDREKSKAEIQSNHLQTYRCLKKRIASR